MFWAPMKTDLPRAASTSAGRQVMAGQRTISAAVSFLMRGKKLVRKALDSIGVLYIFQLAATRSLRIWFLVFHLWRYGGKEGDAQALLNSSALTTAKRCG